MTIKQIYTGCIAHAAYYLASNGEAAIFDPLREVQPYIDRATADNAKIKYALLHDRRDQERRPVQREGAAQRT